MPVSAPIGFRPTKATLIVGSLFVLVFAIYGQVYSHHFVNFDDPLYVSQNEHVLRGLTWSGVKWAFTHVHAWYWLPLTWISHMVDVQLFGRNAGAHLLVSVTLHALNSALLFLFLRRATDSVWRSASVAALFAVHPLHVESVAWIAERKDTLSTFLFLLCLVAYERYVRERSRWAYVVSVLALALGLMAKPMLVTTPFVLLLLDYWPFRRLETTGIKKLLIEKVPFFACVAGGITATLIGQHEAMATTTTIHVSARLANAAISYVVYTAKTVWPSGLAVFYPFPTRIGIAVALSCALLLIGLTALAAWCWRSLPWLVVGWCWFVGTLIPVIGIAQAGQQARADRFTYIPHIGLFVAIVWGIAYIIEHVPGLRTPAVTVSAAIVLAFAVVAHAQVQVWSDSIALFRHALAVTSNTNRLAHLNLGGALLEVGEYEAAEREYRQAEGYRPAEFVYTGLALAFAGEGKLDAAADAARRAIQVNPNSADAVATLGSTELARGDMVAAERALARSLQLKDDPGVAARLALARGQLEKARAQFAEAVMLHPEDADLRNAYAAVLAKMADDADAEQEYIEAIRLNPKMYDARMNYGALLSRIGRDDMAAQQFAEAASIRPGSPEPHVYLGLLEANRRHFDVAMQQIHAAATIDHDLSNRMLINAIRIPPRPTAIDEYIAFLRQQSGGR